MVKGLSVRSMTKRTYKLKKRSMKNRAGERCSGENTLGRGTFVASYGNLSRRFPSVQPCYFVTVFLAINSIEIDGFIYCSEFLPS